MTTPIRQRHRVRPTAVLALALGMVAPVTASDDPAVEAQITRTLSDHDIPEVTATFVDGVATLEGYVAVRDDALIAEHLVESLASVSRVVNHIVLRQAVSPVPESDPSDAELRLEEQARRELATRGIHRVRVTVRTGTATLEGQVDRHADAVVATRALLAVAGIEEVDDRLRVAPRDVASKPVSGSGAAKSVVARPAAHSTASQPVVDRAKPTPPPVRATHGNEIRHLGGPNAMCRVPAETIDEMRTALIAARDEYLAVLADFGWPGDPEDLFAAISGGQLSPARHAPGTVLRWMILRQDGHPIVRPELTWVGENAFQAFDLHLESRGTRYQFTIPQQCCNLALLSSAPAPPPPVARLHVSPREGCAMTNFVFDVAASSDPTEITLLTPRGQTERLVSQLAVERTLSEPGHYEITAVALADDGRRSTPVTTSLRVDRCAPTARLEVGQREAYVGEAVHLDATTSTAAFGHLDSVEFELTSVTAPDHPPRRRPGPFEDWVHLYTPGTYRVLARAVDDRGYSAVTSGAVDVLPRRSWFADVGPGVIRRRPETSRSTRSVGLFGARVGLDHMLADNLALTLAFGGFVDLDDLDGSGLHLDLALDRVFSSHSLGLSPGVSYIHGEDRLTATLAAHVAMDLPRRFRETPVQLFAEVRIMLDELERAAENSMVWGGLRFHSRRTRKSLGD